MFSENDLSLWEAIKKTIKPLNKNKAVEPVPFPKRLRVHAAPERILMNTLDLHGLTVEDAYQTLCRFLTIHVRENSKTIVIITGKGTKDREGLIHKEIKHWLETPFFSDKINQFRWLNGGGALEIMLKRKKKKS